VSISGFTDVRSARLPWWRRWAPVAGLLLLSPFCAEYLIGYQGVITNPVGQVAGVVMVLPIYGAPAVLIREVVRRTGRGWPTMLLLAAAAGLVQAGLVDQSLFNRAEYTDAAAHTLIPGLGVDVSQLLIFVVGHIVWSFGAPIAVVEACVPARAGRPWLRWPGTTVIAVVYVGGAVFYYFQLVVAVGFHATPVQLGAVVLAVAAAVAAAFAVPRRTGDAAGAVPPAWVAGLVALALLTADILVGDQWAWLGVALSVAALAILAVVLLVWSRRTEWGSMHALAVAGAALLVYAALAFAVNPGHVSRFELYAARGVVLVCVVALLLWAGRRVRAVAAA
jgi:hypothetical protein